MNLIHTLTTTLFAPLLLASFACKYIALALVVICSVFHVPGYYVALVITLPFKVIPTMTFHLGWLMGPILSLRIRVLLAQMADG